MYREKNEELVCPFSFISEEDEDLINENIDMKKSLEENIESLLNLFQMKFISIQDIAISPTIKRKYDGLSESNEFLLETQMKVFNRNENEQFNKWIQDELYYNYLDFREEINKNQYVFSGEIIITNYLNSSEGLSSRIQEYVVQKHEEFKHLSEKISYYNNLIQDYVLQNIETYYFKKKKIMTEIELLGLSLLK